MPRHKNEQPSTVNNTEPVHKFRAAVICKWCKVPVMSRTDFSAKLGYEHKKSCPRHRRGH